MANELYGKTIVITGASSGVGRAIALQFARHNTYLILASRNENVLHEVAKECEALGSYALVLPTDVKNPADLVYLADSAKKWTGKIDVWVNNAGVLAAGDFDITPVDIHKHVIETNLLGYMYGAHAALPIFKLQQQGILINNISIGGYLPVPYGAAYTSSKFGLRGFSESLKGELSIWPDIHVCDVYAAFLNTPGIQHAANYTGKVLRPAPPITDPLEVANAIVRIAIAPRSNTYIGLAPYIFKSAHALFPELTSQITGSVMRNYFKIAEPIDNTDGNVVHSIDYGMSVYGNMHVAKRPARKYMLAGALSLFVFGMYLYKKIQSKPSL